ncbi:MAG TPA: hypothetical protein VLA48_06460 [Nitrososphaeraceae archaeon]|nr:hypothetical protein [Nitrososphaeraceae archaeon]
MGRSKIEGTEICLKCGKLGRLRIVSSRNGEYKNAKTREYLRFRHNDSTLKECHSIEQAIKKKELDQIRKSGHPELGLAIYQLGESIQSFGNKLQIMGEMMKEHTVDPTDEKMLTQMMVEGGKKYLKVLNFISNYIQLISKSQKTQEERNTIKKYQEAMEKEDKQWWKKNGEQFKKDPEQFILQYLLNFMKNNQVMYAINYWLEKYELPTRIKKGKEISSKLSESAFGSSKYNNSDFLLNRSD